MGNVDVGIQSHELAAIAVGAAIDEGGENIPFIITADGVWFRFRTAAVERRSHVVLAVKQDAVGVCRQHAIGLHQFTEVGRSSSGDSIDRLTLFRSQCFGVVAIVDGWAATSHEGGASVDGRPTLCYAAGGVERIGYADCSAVVPAHEAATAVGAGYGQQTAGVCAAFEG